MNPFSVLIKPLLSEKSVDAREAQSKYTFQVRRSANKKDIKLAVQELFEVNVVSVNTLLVRGKYRRRGMHSSLTQNKKKAIVSIQNGQKIALFEDQ